MSSLLLIDTSAPFPLLLQKVRKPDAVVAIYPALQVQFSLSPSRLLSVMDPLLPEVGSTEVVVQKLYLFQAALPDGGGAFSHSSSTYSFHKGVLRSCLEAYTGCSAETFTSSDPLLNPMAASPELLKSLPPLHIFAAGLDPLLDDSIMFARRARDAGCTVHLEVFDEVRWGWRHIPL